jgi:hypothetical protein
MYGGVEAKLHSLLTSTTGRCVFNLPFQRLYLLVKRNRGTHWVGPRAGLGIVVKEVIHSSAENPNPD